MLHRLFDLLVEGGLVTQVSPPRKYYVPPPLLSGDWSIGGAGNRHRVRKKAFPQIVARVKTYEFSRYI